MAMLVTIGEGHERRGVGLVDTDPKGGAHTGSLKNIDDYLVWGPRRERRKQTAHMERYLDDGHGHVGRCLAFGKTDFLHHEGEHGWAQEMDRTREQMEITHEDGARTYYHFCISPDPADHVGAEELRDLALEWVERCLPGTQAVVSVHDDNANGIMHAHVIVNAVYPDTGRRIHISDEQTRRNARILQDLCREHEMTAMPDAHEQQQAERRQRWARGSMAERRMAQRGQRSWKQDMRDAVDEAVGEAQSWGKFCYLMQLKGYRVREGRGGEVTYYHPASTGHDLRARGLKLGDAYTKEGVAARLALDMDALAEGALRWRRRKGQRKAIGYRPIEHAVPSGVEELAERLATKAGRVRGARSRQSIEDSLQALATVRREGIRDGRELALMAEAAKARASELTGLTDTAATTLSRLDSTLRQAQEAAGLREEMGRLPAGIWSPRTRRRRNDLEGRAAELERDVDAVLASPSVVRALAALRLGGSEPRVSRLEMLVRVARRQVDDIGHANERERERLEAIIAAAETVRRQARPHDRTKTRPARQGPLKLKPQAKAVAACHAAQNKMAEALEALAAVRRRQEAARTITEMDAQIARGDTTRPNPAARTARARQRADRAQTPGIAASQGLGGTPSAADVRASVRASRRKGPQAGGGKDPRRH